MLRTQRNVGQEAGLHARRQVADAEQRGHGENQPYGAPAQPHGQGAAGELPGAVRVLGADQVQHLDRLTVDGKPGAGGEHHGTRGGQADEQAQLQLPLLDLNENLYYQKSL